MGRLKLLVRLLPVVLLWASTSARAAAEDDIYPFWLDPMRPEIIFLNGEIGPATALMYRRVLSRRPNASKLVLNSPGGLVHAALEVAEETFKRSMATEIPPQASCLSACAFVFFAGRERLAAGSLGVHQMYQDQPDTSSLQLTLSDTLELLDRYGVPQRVITAMLRTPADSMYFFSDQEKEELGLATFRLLPESTIGSRRSRLDSDLNSFGWEFIAILKLKLPAEYNDFLAYLSNKGSGELEDAAFKFSADLRKRYAKAAASSSDATRTVYLKRLREFLSTVRPRLGWRTCNKVVASGELGAAGEDDEEIFKALDRLMASFLSAAAEGRSSPRSYKAPRASDSAKLIYSFSRLGGSSADLIAMESNDLSYKNLCRATENLLAAAVELAGPTGVRIRAAITAKLFEQ